MPAIRFPGWAVIGASPRTRSNAAILSPSTGAEDSIGRMPLSHAAKSRMATSIVRRTAPAKLVSMLPKAVELCRVRILV
jgi:hypothetical protein